LWRRRRHIVPKPDTRAALCNRGRDKTNDAADNLVWRSK